ncbi:hypothetical protein THII_1553 [Thioploca ingrica]|uniref:Uncharacterized protein n=1 Tax=Thioploca ingrica TaxID=40754 RepID=A0A090ALA5_9GAMM|nr:hypothetical protein THII_1553 [Thioploca ingrica]
MFMKGFIKKLSINFLVSVLLILVNINLANAAYDIFVGTQSGAGYGSTGGGIVYRYGGDTNWTNISAGTNIGQAVMDLEVFGGKLYAATQTNSGPGGDSGYGQVWRYNGGTNWTLVGTMGTSVMDLITYRGALYAVVTDYMYRDGDYKNGKLYRYQAPNNWTKVGGLSYTGFRTAIVSSVSGRDEIIIGELNTDAWSAYSPEIGLELRSDPGGSCVWDFAEYNGAVYSGHYWGPIYKTTDAYNWTMELFEGDRHFWALETFKRKLYVGGSGGYYSPHSGRLDFLEGSNLVTVWEYPTQSDTDGITRLAVAPDDSILLIGTGILDGYYTGNGKAEVWVYRPLARPPYNQPRLISPLDYFAGGVQSLSIVEPLPY